MQLKRKRKYNWNLPAWLYSFDDLHPGALARTSQSQPGQRGVLGSSGLVYRTHSLRPKGRIPSLSLHSGLFGGPGVPEDKYYSQHETLTISLVLQTGFHSLS